MDINAFRYPSLSTEYERSTGIVVVVDSGGIGPQLRLEEENSTSTQSTPFTPASVSSCWNKTGNEDTRETTSYHDNFVSSTSSDITPIGQVGNVEEIVSRQISNNEWQQHQHLHQQQQQNESAIVAGRICHNDNEKSSIQRGRKRTNSNIRSELQLEQNVAGSTMNGTGNHHPKHRGGMGMPGRCRSVVGTVSGPPIAGQHVRTSPSSHNRGGWHSQQHQSHSHPGVQINQQQYKEYPYRQQGPSPRFHNGYFLLDFPNFSRNYFNCIQHATVC